MARTVSERAPYAKGLAECLGALFMKVMQQRMRKPYAESFAERLAKMAAKPKLDVQVCDHCNLRCAGCLHFAPLAKKRFLDLDEYAHDLEALAAIDGIEGYFGSIVLMGGEPLLHPNIVEVVRTTRSRLPNENIDLCTNGLLLKRMGDDFWDAIAECGVRIAISPYPIKINYEELARLVRSKGARAEFAGDITGAAKDKQEFIHLALDPEGKCDPVRSFASCPFGGCFMQLSRGAIWPCQVSALHGAFARRFGYGMRDEPEDSLALGVIGSADDIEDFRRKPHPMCRYCDNDALTVAPWGQSEFLAEEWLS